MVSGSQLKYYSSLLRKKFRDSEGKFLTEGKKIIIEGLESRFKCELIFVTHHFAENEGDFVKSLKKYNTPVEILKNKEFLRLTDTQTPQGIAAVFHKPAAAFNSGPELSSGTIVCLESVSDPGNLGTIIRNCDWFGVNEILLDKTCADIYNPKTIRSGAGSVFHVKLFGGTDLFEKLPLLKKKGYQILCADTDGENIFETEIKKNSVLIFASEADGPSMQALSLSDKKITVPRIGKAESLNVASASAVILSHLSLKY